RPTRRSPGSSPRSLTISRTRWSHAASTQGTTPAAGRPTARAPYSSGSPATSATARFPANPRRFRMGEYASSTARAPRPTSTAAAATRRLWARTSRSTSSIEYVLIERFVARHDPLARELEGARRRGATHPLVGRAVLEKGDGALGHLIHRADGRQIARLAVHYYFRQAALAGRHDGHAARHRLERRQPERLALGRQQEQIPAPQQLGDLIDLAEEADVAAQLQAIHLLLRQVPLRPVAREHQGRGERPPHARADADDVGDALHRSEVRDVDENLMTRGNQRAAPRA